MSFPRRRESRKIYKKVILNLFQDLLKKDAANLFSMTIKKPDTVIKSTTVRTFK
ncbi:hypothetical protein [Rickettsia endosymbiont of Orchestes rusci]|uniref:hypothetical protein n=1 Tax=Rickettsia endosymbiont of Orchestes rusci TaxID=3066250 RepID=UPI00313B994D